MRDLPCAAFSLGTPAPVAAVYLGWKRHPCPGWLEPLPLNWLGPSIPWVCFHYLSKSPARAPDSSSTSPGLCPSLEAAELPWTLPTVTPWWDPPTAPALTHRHLLPESGVDRVQVVSVMFLAIQWRWPQICVCVSVCMCLSLCVTVPLCVPICVSLHVCVHASLCDCV